jgi:methylase of polypeptide subunit release factors
LIRRLLAQGRDYLRSGGKLVLEIGADQGEAVRVLAARYVAGARMTLRQDLRGLDRLVILELSETT